MKKKALTLFFNPGSGEAKGDNPSFLLEQAVTHLSNLGFKINVILEKDKARLTKLARKAAKKGVRLAVVMGGDGTIEAVAAGLVGSKTRLGILPNGTFNNLARGLGIPEDLQQACELLKKAPKRRIDVGQVTDSKNTSYFFENVAAGLIPAVYPEVKDPHNLSADKITEAVKTFVGYKLPHFTLTLNGKSNIQSDTLLVTAANTPSHGAVFLEAPGASLRDGLMDIFLYPGFSKADLIAYLAAIRDGTEATDNRIQRYRARKLTIKADQPQSAIADNRPLAEGKLKLRMLPKALRVIAPKTGGLAEQKTAKASQIPTPAAVTANQPQQANETDKNLTKMK